MSEGRLITVCQLEGALAGWARAERDGAEVSDVAALGGNAGLSFRFRLDGRRLAIRLAAPGVPQKGANDVLRQAPLLRALGASGVPVAPVEWAGELLDTGAIMVGWLEGQPLVLTKPHESAVDDNADTGPLVDVALDALAAVHRTDWRAQLNGWSEPVDGAREIDRWAKILGRVGEDADRAERVAALLRRTAPADACTGVVHGDFHLGNLLFEEHAAGSWRVNGIVDWEISAIGPQALDLGWLALFCDRTLWAEPIRDRFWVQVDRDRIVERYRAAGGPAAEDSLDWHQALACFRFAAIIAFQVGLHTSGKREDDAWPAFGPSERALLESAERLAS